MLALLFFHLPTASVLKMSSTISCKRLHDNSLKSLLKATVYKLKMPHYLRCHLHTGDLEALLPSDILYHMLNECLTNVSWKTQLATQGKGCIQSM